MEEFLLPVAIPHTDVRPDKEIPFLGSSLSSFLMYSPLLPSALQHFCHSCSRFAAGTIKKSLFREFPQIISQRVCP